MLRLTELCFWAKAHTYCLFKLYQANVTATYEQASNPFCAYDKLFRDEYEAVLLSFFWLGGDVIMPVTDASLV